MTSFEQLQTVMAAILQVPADQITPELDREGLDAWDSVQHLNLMLAIEDEFGVSMDVEALQSLTSVPKILEYLEGR